ncbi:hypothetical protein DBV15_02358 [Temnothorax longispinosus]|uniref:L27 domain-containing protein n=1 Tax=Temnothorax longispinosus TaxID=300112 RepID=A0A4S2JWT2_9HYME|nr:hypothetical protein DBV15_02358 [Temnothorax longispinosus]
MLVFRKVRRDEINSTNVERNVSLDTSPGTVGTIRSLANMAPHDRDELVRSPRCPLKVDDVLIAMLLAALRNFPSFRSSVPPALHPIFISALSHAEACTDETGLPSASMQIYQRHSRTCAMRTLSTFAERKGWRSVAQRSCCIGGVAMKLMQLPLFVLDLHSPLHEILESFHPPNGFVLSHIGEGVKGAVFMMAKAHRALELLEDYHAKLTRPQDKQLRLAIERVIRIFKSRLFQALLDTYMYLKGDGKGKFCSPHREKRGGRRSEIERCPGVALWRRGKSKGIALKLFLFMENREDREATYAALALQYELLFLARDSINYHCGIILIVSRARLYFRRCSRGNYACYNYNIKTRLQPLESVRTLRSPDDQSYFTRKIRIKGLERELGEKDLEREKKEKVFWMKGNAYFHDKSFCAKLVATTCGIFGKAHFESRYTPSEFIVNLENGSERWRGTLKASEERERAGSGRRVVGSTVKYCLRILHPPSYARLIPFCPDRLSVCHRALPWRTQKLSARSRARSFHVDALLCGNGRFYWSAVG